MINTASWNIIDKIIFRIENILLQKKEELEEAASEPDVELIIAAETEYLRDENEKLKKRELPVYLTEIETSYYCPKCKEHITNLDAKYCQQCGQRIIRHIANRYINESE